MKTRKTVRTLVAVVLLLAIWMTLALPVTATGHEPMPIASDYITACDAYADPMGSGKINIHFNIAATDYMDELGVLQIMVFESTNNEDFTWKQTYTKSSYSNLVSYNDDYHSSYVTYQGIAGRYYKCYVILRAIDDGYTENRYVWTIPVCAT